jgi:Serine aminopeptidase, S33
MKHRLARISLGAPVAAATLVSSVGAAALVACSSSPGGSPTVPPGSGRQSPTGPASAAQAVPPSLTGACGATDGVRARPMWFQASDGVRLYGIEDSTGGTAVVLAHEGGADLCGWLPYIRTLEKAGIRAFAFDFRGYRNSGSPAHASLALGRDLAGAVARVRADGAKHVFLMGASMGGAAVVQNSSGIRVDGLISLSGTRLWPGYGVNNPAGVRRLSAPFLYVGTRDDWRAPRPEAVSVFHSVGSQDKRIVLYPGSTHGWALVELPPYGSRARAMILDWIHRRA